VTAHAAHCDGLRGKTWRWIVIRMVGSLRLAAQAHAARAEPVIGNTYERAGGCSAAGIAVTLPNRAPPRPCRAAAQQQRPSNPSPAMPPGRPRAAAGDGPIAMANAEAAGRIPGRFGKSERCAHEEPARFR